MLFIRAVVITVMDAAWISSWQHCMPRAKMTRSLRGWLTARSQQEGIEEPEWDPQQEIQPDATGGKDIEHYNPDVDYEGSEQKIKQSAPEQREVDLDADIQTWKFPKMGPSARWWCLRNSIQGSCGYIGHQDLKLWPQCSRICTSTLNLAPKQPSCLSESRD